jgi:hypothetical protein
MRRRLIKCFGFFASRLRIAVWTVALISMIKVSGQVAEAGAPAVADQPASLSSASAARDRS